MKDNFSTLDSFSKHGNLIFDELKLSKNLQLKSDGIISRYVGMETPEYLKNEVSNHGLLVVFVPITVDWIQILVVFVTSKNRKAYILSKTLIEAFIHAENAELRVDCITRDGASWNRSVGYAKGGGKCDRSLYFHI